VSDRADEKSCGVSHIKFAKFAHSRNARPSGQRFPTTAQPRRGRDPRFALGERPLLRSGRYFNR